MARMPGTQWVGSNSTHDNGNMVRYDVVCLHTIVGNPPAHAAHFSVRSDGHIYQSRDTAWRSAANYEGNHRVIAIENDDTGDPFPDWNHNDGHAVPAFTSQQIEANAKICAWAYRTHGIPLVACPNSRSTSRGIAYHRQGIDGNFLAGGYKYGGRVSNGEHWSTSFGKVCPGDRRISQRGQIIQRARVLAGLEEDDVSAEEVWEYDLVDGTWNPGGDGSARHAIAYIHQIQKRNENLAQAVASLAAQLAAVQGALTQGQADILAAIQADATDAVDVPALSAALAAELGDDVALEVADELHARLAS